MTDHYELLGVDSDATKDEIKAAYRSEVERADTTRRAQLNRAWNVLSDPIQRQRYDDQRDAVDDDESDEDAAVVVPGRRTTGARRGPQSKVLDADATSSNGSGKNGSGGGKGGGRSGGGGGGGGDDDDNARPRRPQAEPTVELPEGMHLAPKMQRGLGIGLDLVVVIVLLFGCQFLIPGIVSSDYTHNTDIVNTQADKADKAQTREDKANDRLDKANDTVNRAVKSGDTTAESTARSQAATAKSDVKSAEADRKAAEKKRDDAASKTQGPLGISSLIAFVLALLYLVPLTALTGQSVGKKVQKTWLVRTDGSRAGWLPTFMHYVVPLAIGIALPQIGAVIALAMVFWALRDRNEQGLHDKLAKTLVVDSPPA
jgi:curved DNA-binding protein CbpA